jgi:hypothetical protein
VSLKTADGEIATKGTTNIAAPNGDDLLTTSNGGVSLDGITQVTGQGIAIDISGEADLMVAGKSDLTATTGKITATLDDGNISFDGITTVKAKTDVAMTTTGSGDTNFANTTLIAAKTGSVALISADGDTRFKQSTTIKAAVDVTIDIAKGNLTVSEATSVLADRFITINIRDGETKMSHRTIFIAGEALELNSTGGISGTGITDLLATDLVRLTINTGDGDFRNTATIHATVGDVEVAVERGQVELYDFTKLEAEEDLTITIEQGSLFMADAETLIKGNNVTITVKARLDPESSVTGDVAIDLIIGKETVTIEAFDGEILDNTFAEEDLIIAPEVTLVAADGVGIPYQENLNINTRVLGVSNTRSGGINIQNRTGFTVGDIGINLNR